MLLTLRSLLGMRGGKDWYSSSAHLLLLSKFVRPQVAEKFGKRDAWDKALGESPSHAIRRFLHDGVLVSAGIGASLDYRFKATDLRDMLRQRALPVSGRKAELIARLLEADPMGMKDAVSGVTVLQCSARGQDVVEQYLAAERESLTAAQDEVLALLRSRKFKQASLAVATYEAAQVFPKGIGMDWEHYDPRRDTMVLKTIFYAHPKVLASIDRTRLMPLRLAAGMMHLWGLNGTEVQKWIPAGYETGLGMDAISAVRMLISYSIQQAELLEHRRIAKTAKLSMSVSFHTCNDNLVCSACQAFASRSYPLDDVPELPHANCTSENGCRCWMSVGVLKTS